MPVGARGVPPRKLRKSGLLRKSRQGIFPFAAQRKGMDITMKSITRRTFVKACGLVAAGVTLAACGTAAPAASVSAPSASSGAVFSEAASAVSSTAEAGAQTVRPLSPTLDIDKLSNATFAAEFEPSDVVLDSDGAMVIHMVIYDYERFAAADIQALAAGDTLRIDGKDVVVDSVETNEYGLVSVNGGMEENGYDLVADTDGLYYETGTDDMKSYYAIGQKTFPVSQDFVFTDNSDLDHQGKTMLAGDYLTAMEKAAADKTDLYYTPYCITVKMADGKISAVEKRFVP